MIRKIIHIDQEKCNGCGACADACHEGAIGMVDGKARLLRDDYCDGLLMTRKRWKPTARPRVCPPPAAVPAPGPGRCTGRRPLFLPLRPARKCPSWGSGPARSNLPR